MVEQQVWKYVLSDERTTLEVPKGAQVLTVAGQGDDVVLWALVDPTAEKEERQFRVVGTGWSADLRGTEYRGTALIHADALVFHVFEVL